LVVRGVVEVDCLLTAFPLECFSVTFSTTCWNLLGLESLFGLKLVFLFGLLLIFVILLLLLKIPLLLRVELKFKTFPEFSNSLYFSTTCLYPSVP